MTTNTEVRVSVARSEGLRLSERVRALHAVVLAEPPALCIERALLVTRHAREHAGDGAPTVVHKARALAHIFHHKSARIYPGELLVGCFTSHRVGGGIFPELHGLAVLEDLLVIGRREVNPLRLSWADRFRLVAEVVPFWATRNLPVRTFSNPLKTLAFLREQLDPTLYFINEAGGISHFVPDGGQPRRARARRVLLTPRVPPGGRRGVRARLRGRGGPAGAARAGAEVRQRRPAP